MGHKAVYIFCDEDSMFEEASKLYRLLKANALDDKFVLVGSKSTLARYLGKRKNKIDILILYKRDLQEAANYFLQELQAAVEKIMLVHFPSSGNFMDEYNEHIVKLKNQGAKVLFTFHDTAQDVIVDLLTKETE